MVLIYSVEAGFIKSRHLAIHRNPKLKANKFGILSIHDELQLGKLQFSSTFRILNGSHLCESQDLYF